MVDRLPCAHRFLVRTLAAIVKTQYPAVQLEILHREFIFWTLELLEHLCAWWLNGLRVGSMSKHYEHLWKFLNVDEIFNFWPPQSSSNLKMLVKVRFVFKMSLKFAYLANTEFINFAPELQLVHFFSKISGLPATQTWRFKHTPCPDY